jgi:hypothetical protein
MAKPRPPSPRDQPPMSNNESQSAREWEQKQAPTPSNQAIRGGTEPSTRPARRHRKEGSGSH